jgi:hypothetical protein
MDVTSLYTNIPHSNGIEACKEIWEGLLALWIMGRRFESARLGTVWY